MGIKSIKNQSMLFLTESQADASFSPLCLYDIYVTFQLVCIQNTYVIHMALCACIVVIMFKYIHVHVVPMERLSCLPKSFSLF